MTIPRFDIALRGNELVRIEGASENSRAGAELIDWLRGRTDVVDIAWRNGSGALEVRYRDTEGTPPGGFVRSLEDHVYALQRPPPPQFTVAVAHTLPGRARLKFTGVEDDDLVRCAAWLAGKPGIFRANASPGSASMLVLYDPSITNSIELLNAIRTCDRATWPAATPEQAGPRWGAALVNTAVLAACATGIAPLPALAVGVAVTAIPPVRRAARALRSGHVSVDVLDVAAIGIAVATGQPATAAFITWLLGVGDMLLEHSADRARAAISRLMDLDAPEAFRICENGETERISADKLIVGDLIIIDAGRRVAADGVVVSGLAMVDEKALTGESEPRERSAGTRILAATVVIEGQVVVRVERTGVNTTAAKIVKILEGAGSKPMTLQREAERMADLFVLPTFGIAGAAAFLTSTIDRATSVLITDFGTGIRIAIPTTALASMTVAARNGVLVKGAQYLERLAKADVIVFDKTGTLTSGSPEIIDVTAANDFDQRELIRLSAGAEARQAHPIAEAIRTHAARLGIDEIEPELGSETYTIGLGLSATVAKRRVLIGSARWMIQNAIDLTAVSEAVSRHAAAHASTLYVAVDSILAGVIAYADRPRFESANVVTALRDGGRRKVVLLSGDTRGSVNHVAAAVGIDEAFGELLPEDKARYVKEQQLQGRIVAMVGDGINDAPALAVADVGISLHGGTDVALETADVVLLEGGLERLALAFAMGDTTMRNVKRGLGMVIVPNAVAIVLGALGLINPAVAAAVNNGTTVVAALASLTPLLTRRRLSSGARK